MPEEESKNNLNLKKGEALPLEFKAQAMANAKLMAEEFIKLGYRVIP